MSVPAEKNLTKGHTSAIMGLWRKSQPPPRRAKEPIPVPFAVKCSTQRRLKNWSPDISMTLEPNGNSMRRIIGMSVPAEKNLTKGHTSAIMGLWRKPPLPLRRVKEPIPAPFVVKCSARRQSQKRWAARKLRERETKAIYFFGLYYWVQVWQGWSVLWSLIEKRRAADEWVRKSY